MSVVGLIPARWASSRFPGKVATPIAGRSMLERVWRGAKRCSQLRDVIVATDDARVVDLCGKFGARALMTSPKHSTGTDRIAELARELGDQVVVNIQGDEPLIEPFVIDVAVQALVADPALPMATVARALQAGELEDPNAVKLLRTDLGRAHWFSRKPIPAPEGVPSRHWHHVGLYAYRRDFLLKFVSLAEGRHEQAERLEQLRALENGYPIGVGLVEGWRGLSVDVPGDVPRVEAELRRVERGSAGD
jgi:3-deoxy-manno-octulosonate cytidylyltransferase (CMP-KDO synthetase)